MEQGTVDVTELQSHAVQAHELGTKLLPVDTICSSAIVSMCVSYLLSDCQALF